MEGKSPVGTAPPEGRCSFRASFAVPTLHGPWEKFAILALACPLNGVNLAPFGAGSNTIYRDASPATSRTRGPSLARRAGVVAGQPAWWDAAQSILRRYRHQPVTKNAEPNASRMA